MLLTLYLIIFLSCCKTIAAQGKSQLCEVETGQTNIILDIEESRGNSTNQRTIPPQLPISGIPGIDITIDLVLTKGNSLFKLNGKELILIQPLDRDEENLSHIVFQVSCTIISSGRKRNIPVIVRVSDVNDNAPQFMNEPYQVTVPENTPVGTTIFRNIQAIDKDAGVNGLVEYFIVEGGENLIGDEKLAIVDGYDTFAISYPHQGQVTVARSLDYEKVQKYHLLIVASDRAQNVSARLSSTTTLTVNIADSDDQDPSFIYRGCILVYGACINPEYSASVPSGSVQGVLNVMPERIQAVDLDSLNAPIRYTFASGMPGNYADYFEIDKDTGVLKQIKAVDTSTAKKYDIIVRAEEISEAKRFTTAKLAIMVKPLDANPPIISVSDIEGFVDENAPIGTKVLDLNGKPILLKITDADIGEDDPKPNYVYEMTTPSFAVSDEGFLVVNEEGLDRDPPSPGRFKFQVVGREPKTNTASAPLSLTVYLRDVNDNAPKIAMIPPVTITAGDTKRVVTRINATDIDEGENAKIVYSIYHVSNNGMQKFSIDEQTGQVESLGRVFAGEQYSITVQATDLGGLSSQAILEVLVAPGPNTKPPKFEKSIYEVQISEGADINSTVTVVHAEDPESDPVTYSILSGNDLRQFAIGQENGVLMVIRKLDRESLTRYQLIVRAEDSGRLSSSATVNIKVTDINDSNPEFDESTLPYVFEVDEGKANAFVGIVHATDADEGINAEISYSIPKDMPFTIESKSGEIQTATELDYETQKEYRFVVTAKDGAPDFRLGTASVTVKVRDIPDEVPTFTDAQVNVRIPENHPNFLVTTVHAHDPDTIKETTYVIRKGPMDLFKINSETGEIRTIGSLDYEKEKQHHLIVGTIENDGNSPGDTIHVIVDVDDVNDVNPSFISVPKIVNVNDEQAIGSVIVTVPAVDADGTAPNNIIRYEIVGRGKALKYFQIDPDTAAIRVRGDLRKEEDTEYQIDVRAYDMGDPQLSSVASFPLLVLHKLSDPNEEEAMINNLDKNAILSTENMGLAFTDDNYITDVSESTSVNTTLKNIQIINAKKYFKDSPTFKCEIVEGNELELFAITAQDYGCSIQLVASLDYENETSHTLKIALSSHKYLVNPQKSTATVKFIVQDENDNAPQFVFKRKQRSPDTFYTVVSADTDIDTPILQVRATDRDSGKFGMVRYMILEDENDINATINKDKMANSYFMLISDSGVLRTAKFFTDDVSFPLIIFIEALDNDGDENGALKTRARVVINKISDENRLSLAFADASSKEFRSLAGPIEDLLEEKSNGLICRIERFSNRKSMKINEKSSGTENSNATDIWFYVIDPKTDMILNHNDELLRDTLLTPMAQTELKIAATKLTDATAEGIYSPSENKEEKRKIHTALILNDEVFPYTLIAISMIILILGIIGIIYISVSWSRYKHFKQRIRHYSVPTPARYDPVILGPTTQSDAEVVANLKEYETQVLAMAVPPDGDEDLQLDFSAKNHAFSLDNVSYITRKEHGYDGQASPSASEATTATITTMRRMNNNNVLNNMSFGHNNANDAINNRHNRALEINSRYNANPLGSVDNTLFPGSLTLGRIKQQNNHQQHFNKLKNNEGLAHHRNTFGSHNSINGLAREDNYSNTLGRIKIGHGDLYAGHQQGAGSMLLRVTVDSDHTSTTNENVTFGKRNYGQMGFSYLNDLDRSEVETTTEL